MTATTPVKQKYTPYENGAQIKFLPPVKSTFNLKKKKSNNNDDQKQFLLHKLCTKVFLKIYNLKSSSRKKLLKQ